MIYDGMQIVPNSRLQRKSDVQLIEAIHDRLLFSAALQLFLYQPKISEILTAVNKERGK